MSITVNGQPLHQFLNKEVEKEIQEVRDSDASHHLNVTHPSKYRNTSGERSSHPVTIYQNGQPESHIIVCGELFPWIAKAPYVPSGFSVLGALEYSKELDKVKCHTCGEWFKDLSTHITQAKLSHGSQTEYRIRHGFNSRSSINSPSVVAKHAAHARRHFARSNVALNTGENRLLRNEARAVGVRNRKAVGILTRCPETLNLTMSCEAQRIADLRQLTSKLGRTPKKEELLAFVNSHGRHTLNPHGLIRLFGVPLKNIFLRAGIQPRSKGLKVAC